MNKKYLLTQYNEKAGHFETYDIRSGELVAANSVVTVFEKYIYSDEISEHICHKLAEGLSLSDISKLKKMPSLPTIYRWQAVFPEFRNKIRAAKKMRAEVYRDKALAEVENAHTKDDVPIAKFKFDSYMKLAERDNPDDYGSAVQAGSGGVSLQIVVSTGIVEDDIEGEAYVVGESDTESFEELSETTGQRAGTLSALGEDRGISGQDIGEDDLPAEEEEEDLF